MVTLTVEPGVTLMMLKENSPLGKKSPGRGGQATAVGSMLAIPVIPPLLVVNVVGPEPVAEGTVAVVVVFVVKLAELAAQLLPPELVA